MIVQFLVLLTLLGAIALVAISLSVLVIWVIETLWDLYETTLFTRMLVIVKRRQTRRERLACRA